MLVPGSAATVSAAVPLAVAPAAAQQVIAAKQGTVLLARRLEAHAPRRGPDLARAQRRRLAALANTFRFEPAVVEKPRPKPKPAAPAAPVASGTFSEPPGSFEVCVIAHESGGNATAVNPTSGAGGLFQFLLPENAPVSEQYAAFNKLYAETGTAPWAGDGYA